MQIKILRMKSEGRDDVIGIGVAPGTADRCIINRQDLDDLHASSHGPVDQQVKVAKVANPTRVVAAEREYWHTDTSSAPRLLLHSQALAIDHEHRTIWNRRLV